MLTRNALDWAKLLAAASKVARTVAYPPSSVYPPLDTVPKHDAVPGPIVSTPAAGTVSGSYDHGVDLNEVENGRLEKETAFESTGNRNRSPMEPKFNEPSWAETSGSDLNISSADSLETADVPSRVGAAAENMLDRPALRSSAVPTGRLGRLFRYGGLALGVGYGTATEAVRRIVSPGSHEGNIVLNEQNMDRFVDTLSRMRGAALKLGQMLSIQDNAFLPPQLQTLLLRVQNNAHYMPQHQLEAVLNTELGHGWRDQFMEFDSVPIAAASIGQVHRATLLDGSLVAVKVQYPGVAESIDSDLDNLKSLLLLGNLLPRGLFLDSSVAAARKELAWETDYVREAESTLRFGHLLADDACFSVPNVITELSGRRVLTTTWAQGVPLGQLEREPQAVRDWVATRMLDLCLRELFVFKFMQTDPNWTNFFYDGSRKKIVLLDFGSARSFEDGFLDDYMEVLRCAADQDHDGIVRHSVNLGFLTGAESEAMKSAHVEAVSTLAKPFMAGGPELYDFGKQDVTERVKSLIPTMLRERLTPPPEPTYSLHRKLSGAFLLCSKLRARVPCRKMFIDHYDRWNKASAS